MNDFIKLLLNYKSSFGGILYFAIRIEKKIFLIICRYGESLIRKYIK